MRLRELAAEETEFSQIVPALAKTNPIRLLSWPKRPQPFKKSAVFPIPAIIPAETATTQPTREYRARSDRRVWMNPLKVAILAIRTQIPTSWPDKPTISPIFRNPDMNCCLSKSLLGNLRSVAKPTELSRRCHDSSPTGKVSALSADRPNWCDTVEPISQANRHQKTLNCADTVCTIANKIRLTGGNDTTDEG